MAKIGTHTESAVKAWLDESRQSVTTGPTKVPSIQRQAFITFSALDAAAMARGVRKTKHFETLGKVGQNTALGAAVALGNLIAAGGLLESDGNLAMTVRTRGFTREKELPVGNRTPVTPRLREYALMTATVRRVGSEQDEVVTYTQMAMAFKMHAAGLRRHAISQGATPEGRRLRTLKVLGAVFGTDNEPSTIPAPLAA